MYIVKLNSKSTYFYQFNSTKKLIEKIARNYSKPILMYDICQFYVWHADLDTQHVPPP